MDEDITDGGDEAHGSHDHDDTTHDAIDEPEGTDVEMRSHLIDEPGDPKPPCYRSGKDGYIARYIMVSLKLRRKKTEAGEKTDDEEENERIGEGEEKSCGYVAPRGRGVHSACLKRAGGIAPEKVAGRDQKHHRAYELQECLIGFDKISDKRETQTGEQTIYEIAESGSYPCEERRPTSFAESALNTQHSYRSHRGRHKDADKHTSEHYDRQMYHQLYAKLLLFPNTIETLTAV